MGHATTGDSRFVDDGLTGAAGGSDVVVAGVELVREIGRGARTTVYHGRRDGRDYAVKVLRTSGDQREAAEFRREAALLAALDHPDLVRIHDVGESAGHAYLIMDLIAGHSLAEVLAGGPLDEPAVVALAREVAGVLRVAHRAALVHRDVKPQNIMIRPDGRARLIDFGLAARSGVTSTDIAAGTFVYSAPEQTGALRRPVDGRSDLYALGVVLFECLAGRPPFAAADVGELIRLHVSTAPPDLRTLAAGVSPALAAVVAKLLAKDPDDRYQAGDGLLADLGRIAAGERDVFPLGATDALDAGGSGVGLVGRADEVDRLSARWQQATADPAQAEADEVRGGFVLIEGPPGAGKSRLARELVGAARAAGHPVLHGKCVPDGAVPLGPIREAVEAFLAAQLDGPERAAAERRIRAAAGPGAGLLGSLSPALAALLGTVEVVEHDNQQQFANAVGSLLTGLADAAGGAVLHLDDVQWCDDATRRVLRVLGAQLAASRLLVVATARDDATSRDHVEQVLDDLESACDLRLALGPLDDQQVAALVAAQLGSAAPPPQLAVRLAARSAGNPLAVIEYVRAVMDAGLLRPSWDAWLLDETGLDALDLPADVMDLVLRRVDGLGDRTRRLLRVAATVGNRFDPELVSAVCAMDAQLAAVGIADAVGYRLVEPAEAGHFMFLHDRIREALLSELDEAESRETHQRIAEELERRGGDGPAQVYAVARHYLRGTSDRTPDRVFRAAAAAGFLAVAQHAPTDAVEFLRQAELAATAAGLRPDAAFHTALGVAATRTGLVDLAHHHLDEAMAIEDDRLRRANLCGLQAEVCITEYDGDRGLDAVRRGFAELGRPLPVRQVSLVFSALGLFLLALLLGVLPERVRLVRGVKRERYRLQAYLGQAGTMCAAVGLRETLMPLLELRSVYLTTRLGPGLERALNQRNLAVIVSIVGLRGLGRRLMNAAESAVAGSGDPRLIAQMLWSRGICADAAPGIGGQTGWHLARTLETHRRWLDRSDYLIAVGVVALVLVHRGYADQALYWRRQAVGDATSVERNMGDLTAPSAAQAAAMAGRPAETAELIRAARHSLACNPGSRSQRHALAIAAIHIAYEQGETGAVFDQAIVDYDALNMSPFVRWSFYRIVWIYRAFGRLAQLAAANGIPTNGIAAGVTGSGVSDAERTARVAAARREIFKLRLLANGPVLRAYHRVARASLRQLTGDHTGALRALCRVERWAGTLDLPILGYEIARVRARAYLALDAARDARRQAGIALLLATEYGWPVRAQWIRTEFGLDAARPGGEGGARGPASASDGGGTRSAHRSRAGVSGPTGASGHRQRRLEALQQVSIAAATVLDPAQLARVALDEMVKIFAAERAFLFLQEDGRTVPYLGRDSSGADLTELTGYGSTLVRRVVETGEALVITGGDEGAAFGSQSTVMHGLRSIMVAPLRFKGRLLGVVYLDSRAAKGIFDTDDISILAALTNQIAAALETARAAQLELAVHAAQQQRDVAETLRRAMADLAGSLDPEQVANRLLDAVARVLPVHRAVLLHRGSENALLVMATYGLDPAVTEGASGPDGGTHGSAGASLFHADVAGLLGATGPVQGRGRPPLPALLGTESAGWLAVSMQVRGEQRGLLVVTTIGPDHADGEVRMVAALVGHGAAALDNALLFRQVEQLAANDGLTGLFNRRHFTAVAADRLTGEGTASTIMVDIDNFKSINDTYGHGVGDEVIRAVAERLTGSVREGDVVCRYGGEEFAVLLPDTGPSQAEWVARRVHGAVLAEPVATAAGPLRITVSVGVAVPAQHDRLELLLARADDALYEAKRDGRNRVVVG